jgi:hypothetical protein
MLDFVGTWGVREDHRWRPSEDTAKLDSIAWIAPRARDYVHAERSAPRSRRTRSLPRRDFFDSINGLRG